MGIKPRKSSHKPTIKSLKAHIEALQNIINNLAYERIKRINEYNDVCANLPLQQLFVALNDVSLQSREMTKDLSCMKDSLAAIHGLFVEIYDHAREGKKDG
jgi:hypothetical protein